MHNIKTYNAIAPVGLARFSADQYNVGADIEQADAMLLRSHKLGIDELQPGLRAIARAGAGTNNVPVEECSNRGIVVFNTPGANANSVKELVLTGLLLASRDVLGGINYVRSLSAVTDEAELNKLVEAEKKTIYQNSFSFFEHDDTFIEPIEAAICAIELSRTADAKKFLDLSARSLSHINEYISPIKIGLFESTKLINELQNTSLEKSISAYNNLLKNYKMVYRNCLIFLEKSNDLSLILFP